MSSNVLSGLKLDKHSLAVDVVRSPKGVDNTIRQSVEIILEVLRAIGVQEVWECAFLKMHTKKCNIKFQFVRQSTGPSPTIIVRTKTGGKQTCWEAALRIPLRYDIHTISEKLKRIDTRTLVLRPIHERMTIPAPRVEPLAEPTPVVQEQKLKVCPRCETRWPGDQRRCECGYDWEYEEAKQVALKLQLPPPAVKEPVTPVEKEAAVKEALDEVEREMQERARLAKVVTALAPPKQADQFKLNPVQTITVPADQQALRQDPVSGKVPSWKIEFRGDEHWFSEDDSVRAFLQQVNDNQVKLIKVITGPTKPVEAPVAPLTVLPAIDHPINPLALPKSCIDVCNDQDVLDRGLLAICDFIHAEHGHILRPMAMHLITTRLELDNFVDGHSVYNQVSRVATLVVKGLCDKSFLSRWRYGGADQPKRSDNSTKGYILTPSGRDRLRVLKGNTAILPAAPAQPTVPQIPVEKLITPVQDGELIDRVANQVNVLQPLMDQFDKAEGDLKAANELLEENQKAQKALELQYKAQNIKLDDLMLKLRAAQAAVEDHEREQERISAQQKSLQEDHARLITDKETEQNNIETLKTRMREALI